MLLCSRLRKIVLSVSVVLSLQITYAGELENLVKSNPAVALKKMSSLSTSDHTVFLTAVAYENLGKTPRAIKEYKKLILRNPERVEAYVNLANIYSSQGNYELAAKYLEESFNQHPVYADAYEGLQKLYAHKAAVAYKQALNKKINVVKPQLARVSELHTTEQLSQVIAAVSRPIKPEPIIKVVPKPEVKPTPVVVKPAIKPTAKPEIVKVPEVNLSAVVENWAAAWSAQDVDAFVSFYKRWYSTPGKNHAQWVNDRQVKLTNKRYISVVVSSIKQKKISENRFAVDFTQNYQSDAINDTIRKRLVFDKINGQWKISNEKVI